MTNLTSTALITGGSSGIGLELAKVFARNGHNLVLIADGQAKLEAAAQNLRNTYPGRTIETCVSDLATPDGPRQVYAAMRKAERTIDILVNNAGSGVYGDFARETDLGAELKSIQLNVAAPVILSKLFVQDMLRQNHGKILFTASIAGVAPSPNLSVYAATKAFIYHFAEGLRDELRNTPITVTALLPGLTDTNFFARAHMEEVVRDQQMDNPADVAQAGYDALMAGDDHVVVSLKNKMQVAMAKIMPITLVTAQARQ